jgi:hypothetical protein
MGATTNRMLAVAGLAVLASAGVPALASAGQSGGSTRATLYELTESMKIIQKKQKRGTSTDRIATSVLSGVSNVGSPLCPDPKFASGPGGCSVTVLGSDDINLATGLGTITGSFATQVQGDNPVDGPEATVLTGAFSGWMDFSPAILRQTPYGTVVGIVSSGRRRSATFTGVFRLPFAGNVEVEVAPGVKLTLRQIFCPASPAPNPFAPMYGGVDLAYLDFDAQGQPNGECLDIQPTELSLGTPLVRFDVRF